MTADLLAARARVLNLAVSQIFLAVVELTREKLSVRNWLNVPALVACSMVTSMPNSTP